MDPFRIGLFVILIPGVIAAVAVWVFGGRRGGGALAAVGAALVGAVFVLGLPPLWPTEVTDRFVHVLVLGFVGALTVRCGRRRRWIALAAIAGLVAALIVGPLLAHRFPGGRGVLALLVASVLVVVLWSLMWQQRSLGDRAGLSIGMLSMISATLTAGMSGSIVLAQLGASVCAAVGGVWLIALAAGKISLVRRRLRGANRQTDLWGELVPLVTFSTWTVIAIATLYASMTTLVALLNLLIPLAAIGSAWAVPGRWKVRVAIVAAVLASTFAVIGALELGNPDNTGDDASYGYE